MTVIHLKNCLKILSLKLLNLKQRLKFQKINPNHLKTRKIADETSGDLFEIEPVNVYSDDDLDWTNHDSRVCYEHENPESRNVELVSIEVADWDSYDTVFIGYPIWWGEAAWVVDNFVKGNDFTDKTVIPFCTSSSSGLGESGKLLADMAGSGNWIDGERFQSGVAEDDVKAWVNSLGM